MKKAKNSIYWGMEATTNNRDWGFTPVPNKGGNTTNADIPDWMFLRELNDMEGGALDGCQKV